MGPLIGEKLGNYRLLRLLGRGAFAEVYLGEHHYLHSYAALKLLHASLTDKGAQRFLSEAQTLVQLRHPYIVRVLEFFIEGTMPVLVMDYAPQGTLRQSYPSGERLSLATTVTLIQQAASALQYAHNHHIIHRDIKPENMLLDAEQNLLLSDFGLALLAPPLQSLSTQAMAGTVAYSAPEQLRGKPVFASDQYALGVITYEWLCGVRPFVGGFWDVVSQHQSVAPPPLREKRPDLPSAVEMVVLRALAKTPLERFASVQAFAQALERAALEEQAAELFADQQATAPRKAIFASALVPSPQQQTSVIPYKPFLAASDPHSSVIAPINNKESTGKRSRFHSGGPNRQRLLSKVRAFWITGVLEQSLHGAALITLGLQEKSDAVMNSWQFVLQQPGTPERLLSSGTSITQVYDAAGGELLLLGEPGSGKTTLLLQLTRDLLDRAEIDESHPLPVVFNLSSWAQQRLSVTAWLVEELHTKYQVPRKLGQAWVASDLILPLLDGLDEVVPQYRAACLGAINAYRQEHGLLPTVVCSRSTDYLLLKEQILLRDAVTVQPLTTEQIDEYLSSLGEQVETVSIALHQDAELRELMATPLMLSIVTLAYQGASVDDLLTGSSLSERRQHIFKTYVERMLQRRGMNIHYTSQQTIHWLKWLAEQMVRRGQTVFYMERMQPDWLPTEQLRRLHPRLMVGLVFGVIFGLTFTAYNWSRFHPWITLGIGLAYVLIFGLLNALAYRPEREKRVVSEAVKLRKYIMRDVLKVMLNGLLTGVVTIGCDAILSSPMDRTYLASPFLVLASALNISLFGSVLFLLISGLVGKLTESIQPAEVIAWSWTNMGWNFLKFLLIGFWGGVLISPLYQVAYAIYTGQLSKTDPPGILLNILSIMINGGWLIAATFGILGGFIGGFTGGLSSSMGDDSNLVKPNQGIIRSAKNGLIVGLIIYLTFVILAQIVFIGRITDLSIMVVTLLFGLMIGIIGGLRSGGTAYAQHTLLRLLLWQTKCVPWHYAHFLDYAVAHILLQRVGGGYIFVHRLLLEYFVPPNVVSLSNTQPLSLRQTFSPSQGELVLGPCTSQTIASVLSTQKNRPDVARRRIALLALTGITGCTSLGGIVTWSRLHQPLYSSIQRSFPTTRVMWSSNGNYIASTETNPNGLTARIWSSDNGQLIYSAPGLSSVDSAIAWSPADSRIVWITSKGMIKILDVANTAHILTYAEGTSSIACLAWSPDSRYIAIGYEHGVVQIRSTIKATHDLAYQIVATEKNGDKIAAITWSPDGKHLATFNNHATLKIWDALNGSHRATYTHHQVWPPTMRWSLDGRYLAWIADEVMKVWSGVEENHLSSYPLENGDLITAMAWAPDSKQVVLGSSRGIVQVWEVATWRLAYTYRQHGGSVSSVGWSLDGKYIASGSSDGTVQVWNVKGDLVRFYWTPGGPSGVGHVEWSPDGKRIVSGYHDGSMRVWRVF